MASKRLVIVNHVAELGGAERVLMDMLLHLDKSKYEVDMIFLEEGRLVALAESYGCRVHTFRSGRIRSPMQYWRTISLIRKVIRKADADMVINWAPKPHVYGGIAAMLEGKPSIWWQHGVPSGSMFDKVVSRIPATAILCPSESVKQAQATISPNKHVTVNYPGINESRFSYSNDTRALIRKQYGIPEDAFVFTFIGRLQRWKRTDVVIKAFEEALKDCNAYLVIVGGALFGVETDYQDELQRIVLQAGLENQVIFAGHQQNVEDYISASEVVVHSSLFEPFGMVVVEAMASGRVVLAVGKGGPSEIISHGTDGFLYDGSAGQLADLMRNIYTNKAEAVRMGEQAKLTIQSRFTAGIMAERFQHVVEERMAH